MHLGAFGAADLPRHVADRPVDHIDGILAVLCDRHDLVLRPQQSLTVGGGARNNAIHDSVSVNASELGADSLECEVYGNGEFLELLGGEVRRVWIERLRHAVEKRRIDIAGLEFADSPGQEFVLMYDAPPGLDEVCAALHRARDAELDQPLVKGVAFLRRFGVAALLGIDDDFDRGIGSPVIAGQFAVHEYLEIPNPLLANLVETVDPGTITDQNLAENADELGTNLGDFLVQEQGPRGIDSFGINIGDPHPHFAVEFVEEHMHLQHLAGDIGDCVACKIIPRGSRIVRTDRHGEDCNNSQQQPHSHDRDNTITDLGV